MAKDVQEIDNHTNNNAAGKTETAEQVPKMNAVIKSVDASLLLPYVLLSHKQVITRVAMAIYQVRVKVVSPYHME